MDITNIDGYIIQKVLDCGLCNIGLKVDKGFLGDINDFDIVDNQNQKIDFLLQKEEKWDYCYFNKPIMALEFDKSTFTNRQKENMFYICTNNQQYKIKETFILTVKEFSGAFFGKLPYQLFSPKINSNNDYPLVVFLHGSGERGNDNILQLIGNKGATVFADKDFQQLNPCYVVAPQAPLKKVLNHCWIDDDMPQYIIKLINHLIDRHHIDKKRIYLVGMSNGGSGVWKLIYENPLFFAGAIVMCGIVDTNSLDFKLGQSNLGHLKNVDINRLRSTPIYICHDKDDMLIDYYNSLNIYNDLKDNGKCFLKLTEGYGHSCWKDILNDKCILKWLFEQKRI